MEGSPQGTKLIAVGSSEHFPYVISHFSLSATTSNPVIERMSS